MKKFFNDLATIQPSLTLGNESLEPILRISDDVRNVRVWKSHDSSTLAFGFGETKGPLTWPLNKDWKQNFSLKEKRFYVGVYPMYGPEGFANEFLSMRNQLEDLIRIYQPSSVFIGGRSQGGAHALYFYSMLILEYPHIKVYGMGIAMPEALDVRSQMFLEIHERTRPEKCEFTRLTVAGDPITASPLWMMGYAHHGKETRLGDWTWNLWPFNGHRHTEEVYSRHVENFEN